MSDMDSRIREQPRYVTPDGEAHASRQQAMLHLAALDAVDAANALLAAGATLAEVADAHGPPVSDEDRAILAEANGSTGIRVSHYQCGDGPYYRVDRVDLGGPFVWGIGGWTGGFGATESWRTVAQWLRDTKDRMGLGDVRDNPEYAAHLKAMGTSR